MFKEVYDTREILLGLRNVYQSSKQQLDDLKKYVNISPRIGDCGFVLYPCGPTMNDFVIIFKYTMASDKGGLLKAEQMNYIYASIGIDYANNKVYTNCPYMKIKKHSEFIETVANIYKSDFVKLIKRDNMRSLDVIPAVMYTTLNEINIFINESNNTYNSLLSYDSYNDQLLLTLLYNMKVNMEFITKVLDNTLAIQFERPQFSNYILENIQDVDTSKSIKISDYRTNIDNSRTFIFGIDKQRSMTIAKELTF
jgi:hypothetical protein